MAPSIAAPPAMSYFIFSMLSAGLIEMPARIEGDAFADQAKHGAVLHARGLIAKHNQRRRLGRTLRDAPERAHLQLVQFLGRVDCAGEPHFLRHLRGALPENGRGQLVARLVHQRAGKVLALADDDAFGKGGFDRGLIGACGAATVKDCTLWSLRSLR